jgi:hypothetical protein
MCWNSFVAIMVRTEIHFQYGQLNLRFLTWKLDAIPATALIAATVYEDFAGFR